MAEEAQVAATGTTSEETAAPAETNDSLLAPADPEQKAPVTEAAQDDEWNEEDVQLDTSKSKQQADPNLILGKYKTQDDLIKAYKELESKQGKIAQNVPPEKYNLEESMREVGWVPLDKNMHPEAYETFEKNLREHNFTQKQTEFMMRTGRDIIAQQVAKMGPATDAPAEMAALKDEWGKSYDSKRDELSRWATSNVNSDLLTKPLSYTKEGMKLLYDMMARSKGASPITDSERAPAFDKDSAMMEVDALMKNPDYWKSGAAGEAMRSKAEAIFRKMK